LDHEDHAPSFDPFIRALIKFYLKNKLNPCWQVFGSSISGLKHTAMYRFDTVCMGLETPLPLPSLPLPPPDTSE